MPFRYFFIAVFFICLGVLSACTLPGTQPESTTKESTQLYTGSGFRINVPQGWVLNDAKNLPTPKNGKVVLTAVSPEVRYGFSNNILILKDTLNTPTTSRSYSELNEIQTTRNYLEYTKISSEPLLFGDDDDSRVHVFEARYNSTTNRMKFIQTAKVCGTDIYMIHAAVALDRQTKNYIDLFRSFECR